MLTQRCLENRTHYPVITEIVAQQDRAQYGARNRGGAMVEALRYKPEGRGIDSRWCHWNFSFT
jgi:hypothetical protein